MPLGPTRRCLEGSGARLCAQSVLLRPRRGSITSGASEQEGGEGRGRRGGSSWRSWTLAAVSIRSHGDTVTKHQQHGFARLGALLRNRESGSSSDVQISRWPLIDRALVTEKRGLWTPCGPLPSGLRARTLTRNGRVLGGFQFSVFGSRTCCPVLPSLQQGTGVSIFPQPRALAGGLNLTLGLTERF